MEETLSFGYWVRRRRKALDLTQAELGRRVGASAAMIRKIEADERRPSRELARGLADQLAIPAQERDAFLRAARDPGAVSRLVPAAGPAGAPLRALPSPAALPAPMTSLINRVSALAELTALLRRGDVRLITLTGPPGIGKTRLSIQAAWQVHADFADGAAFVDLSSTSDARQVMPAIALTLELPPAPGLSAARHVAMALHGKEMLLVLDNLEQIVEGAALEIAGLLRACPGLKVLATSRLRLDIYGEHEYVLPPMTLPPAGVSYTPAELLAYEAVQLFVDRARQHQPAFQLTPETAGPVAAICRRMDGLPLALELAAARTRQLSPPALESALREASGRDWHALLETTTRDLPPRQRTLFNAVAWSYSLLAPAEQAVLRRLAVFEGDFDAPAAAAVCGGEEVERGPGIVASLALLTEHHLVSQVARQPARWRLLELIRAFALSQLDEEEGTTVRQRHARTFAARLSDLSGDQQEAALLQAIDADLENARAALRYAVQAVDAPLAAQLALPLGRYWERRGLLYEGRAALDDVLALPGAVDPQHRFWILHEAIIMAWMQQDFTTAERFAEEAMVLAHERQLLREIASLLNLLGRIYLEQARYADADRTLLEAIALSGALEPPRPAGMEIIQRGEAALALGDFDLAHQLTLEGLAAIDKHDVIPYCMGWNNVAEVALARGDGQAAREALWRMVPQVYQHLRRARIFLVTAAGLLLTDPDVDGEPAATATRLLAAVSATNKRAGDPLSPLTQAAMSAREAAARTALSAEAWQRAWEVGQQWTLEEALEAAQLIL